MKKFLVNCFYIFLFALGMLGQQIVVNKFFPPKVFFKEDAVTACWSNGGIWDFLKKGCVFYPARPSSKGE